MKSFPTWSALMANAERQAIERVIWIGGGVSSLTLQVIPWSRDWALVRAEKAGFMQRRARLSGVDALRPGLAFEFVLTLAGQEEHQRLRDLGLPYS